MRHISEKIRLLFGTQEALALWVWASKEALLFLIWIARPSMSAVQVEFIAPWFVQDSMKTDGNGIIAAKLLRRSEYISSLESS